MTGEGIPTPEGTPGPDMSKSNGDDPGSPVTGELLPHALADGTDTLEPFVIEEPPEDPQPPASN